MDTIQFHAVVGPDQVIRPPTGVALPEGEIEVLVRVRTPKVPESLAATTSWLLSLAEDAERAQPNLPSDMAANHDHYAHGKPRL